MNYISRRSRQTGLFRSIRTPDHLRCKPRLEELDARIVPASLVFTNETGTSHVEYADYTGTGSQDGGFERLLIAAGNAAQAQTTADSSDGGLDLFSDAVTLSGLGSDSAAASFSGSFDATVEPESGDVAGSPAILALDDQVAPLDAGSAVSFSVNGQSGSTDPYSVGQTYVLTTIGGSANVTFNTSASASGGGSSSGEISFFPTGEGYSAINQPPDILSTPDLRTKNGQALQAINPEYMFSDGPTYTYSFDFNNDGKIDYVETGNGIVPWATLQSLGLTSSDKPYTYSVRIDEDLSYYGFKGTWSAQSTGNLYIDHNPTLVVSAADNLETSPSFGPYLPGVNFNVPFTIQLTDSSTPPWMMGYSTDGGKSLHAATPTKDPYTFTFNLNVGQFKAGDQEIDFGAIDKKFNLIASSTGTLDLTMKPDFNLEVAPLGSPTNLISAKNARFVHGPTAMVEFVGNFSNVPSYYDTMLSVSFGGRSWLAGAGVATMYTDTIPFPMDAGKLNVGVDQANAKIGSWTLKPSDPTSVDVHVINEPNWLKRGNWQFDDVAGDYLIKDATVPLAPPPKNPQGGPIGWLNSVLSGLKTSNELDAIMNLDASMNTSTPVDWSGSQLHAKAVVLGNTILDQTYTTAELAIGGTIDPLSLNPAGLSMKFANPIDLGMQTLLNKQAVWALSANTKYGHLNVGMLVGLFVQGDVIANAGILLNTVNNVVQWGPSGTFFSLNSTATASLTLAVAVNAPGGWLNSITASGAMNLNLNISGTVNYSGTAGNTPTESSSTYLATLQGNYDFQFHGTVTKLLTEFDFYSVTDDSRDGPIPKITLFKF
jgi:hypothetical protein